jgi:putative Holliday junction resolvase
VNRTLGIDYGDTRIGIAVSDPLKIISKPLRTVKNNDNFLTELQNIIKEKNVDAIVVGYPIGMKGQVTKQTEKVDSFIELLAENINIKILKVDERLSSVSASKSLILQGIKTGHNKELIDDTSAAIILQEFLDRK